MAIPKLQYTPVRAGRRGRQVHAMSLRHAPKSACGKSSAQWMVAALQNPDDRIGARVTCRGCRLAVGLDCRPRTKRRR